MNKTIAAICTPPGEGGLSVIRISGEKAFEIACQIFSGNVRRYESHTAHYGKIVDKLGEVIDEVVLLVMHKGKSYTGDATVEIMCHGGTFITQKVFARVLEAGASPAGPGEFTERAFRNGNIDLAQAEAVQELIGAKSERALKAAEKQLGGHLSIRINEIQKNLTDITAILEAWVDYPEEGLEFASLESILEMLEIAKDKLSALASTFRDGTRLTNGIKLCLLGSPNVGKSSLMNALLDRNRAIVTEIAGTTRDILSEELIIGGIHFSLADTAGIRATEEVIEKEGIRRSKGEAAEADLVLIVFDVTKPISNEEQELINSHPEAILIWNKTDLPHDEPSIDGIHLSAKSREGIETLKERISDYVWHGSLADKEAIIITKERHFRALIEAVESVGKVIDSLKTNISPEFIVYDIRAALKALSTIIGTNITEDILGAIFSKFCVGK